MYSRAKQTKTTKQKDFWPSWRYSPDGEGRVFDSPTDVPFGWTKKVGQLFEGVVPVELDKEQLTFALVSLGVTVNPIWGKAQLKKELDDRSPAR